MIVRTQGDDYLLIRQTDHAVVSGVFARQWGNTVFSRPEPLESLRLAAAEHDNGWREWEQRPRLDPITRKPYQFTELPVDEHLAFYQRGIERVLQQDRYAALLVSMHCTGIYCQRYGTDPGLQLKRYSAETENVVNLSRARLETQQQRLREELRADARYRNTVEKNVLWANYKRLQMTDRLSLYFCMAPPNSRSLGPAPLADDGRDADWQLEPAGGNKVAITPYPFCVQPLEIAIPFRSIPRKTYGDDAEFQETLAQAPEQFLKFVLCGA